MWKLNSIFLNNQWVKEIIKKEVYLVLEKQGDTLLLFFHQNSDHIYQIEVIGKGLYFLFITAIYK